MTELWTLSGSWSCLAVRDWAWRWANSRQEVGSYHVCCYQNSRKLAKGISGKKSTDLLGPRPLLLSDICVAPASEFWFTVCSVTSLPPCSLAARGWRARTERGALLPPAPVVIRLAGGVVAGLVLGPRLVGVAAQSVVQLQSRAGLLHGGTRAAALRRLPGMPDFLSNSE